MASIPVRLVRKLKRLLSFSKRAAPVAVVPPVPVNNPFPIQDNGIDKKSNVDQFWGVHTVRDDPFPSAQASIDFLKWRSNHVHLSYEFKRLWADHTGKEILDYGCGPGHDLTGFCIYSNAAKVYSVDVSRKALMRAGHNLALHGVSADRVALIQTADLEDRIPLEDNSVDLVHSSGVIHHTTNPGSILRELYRVLRPGGNGTIMVYNRASVYYHLYVAYMRRLLDPQFAGMTIDQVFVKSTDGMDCPVSRSYPPDEFSAMCAESGFEVEFVGGYVVNDELDWWKSHGKAALEDLRLEPIHRDFLRSVTWDHRNLPMYNGKYAGIGGTFRLHKPK